MRICEALPPLHPGRRCVLWLWNAVSALARSLARSFANPLLSPLLLYLQLLQLLPLTTSPTDVVEALPHFVGDSPSDVDRVVKEYRELLSGDRSMLVHIIG